MEHRLNDVQMNTFNGMTSSSSPLMAIFPVPVMTVPITTTLCQPKRDALNSVKTRARSIPPAVIQFPGFPSPVKK